MMLEIWGNDLATQTLAAPVRKGAANTEGTGSGEKTRAQKKTRQTSAPKAPKQPKVTDVAAEATRKGAPTTSEAKKPDNTTEAKGPKAAKSKASSGTRPVQSSVLARLVGSSSRAPG